LGESEICPNIYLPFLFDRIWNLASFCSVEDLSPNGCAYVRGSIKHNSTKEIKTENSMDKITDFIYLTSWIFDSPDYGFILKSPYILSIKMGDSCKWVK